MRWFAMKKSEKRRARGGFTLAEVLVVVGILAALTLVAVPSVLYYQRTLKYNELDDNARAIFVAAQNRLTALRSASAEKLTVPDAGRPAAEVPAGAVDGLESGTQLWYVSTDVAGADPDWLVLPGSIESDLAGGCYLVEFDPVSGAVYGVFFAERDGTHTLNEAAYQKICQYTDDGSSCRVKKGRQAFARASGGFPVGYYGADGALDLTRPESETLPKPTVKLINAEELVLEIGTDVNSWSSTVTASKVYLSVTVSDGTTAKTLVSKGAIPSGSSATVVLDTLKTSGYNRNETQNTAGWTVGGSFAQWAEGTALLPGEDITVTASTWYQPGTGEGVVALPQTTSVTTNSLFAARTGDTVDVAYGRHLQNLSSSLSHLDPSITAARQVREIDFAKTGDPATHKDDVYYWIDAYPGKNFSSIYNANLTSYDGSNLAIRNMTASGMPNGGLFSNFDKGRLANIVLVDATASGGLSAGPVAGVAGKNIGSTNQVVADNCQVYLTRYTDASRAKGANAGGLFGIAENVTIQNSFAATVAGNETGNTGGLVGFASNVIISNSYAAGHLTGRVVGGLVGAQESYTSTITIEDSYAAGTIIKAGSAAGGMLGSYASNTSYSSYPVTIRRSYAAVDYGTVPAGKVYGLIPPNGSCANAYYLVKSGVNENGVGIAVADPGQMKKSQGLALGSAFIEGGNAGVMAQPYNLPNTADGARDPKLYAPYPYPTLTAGEGRMPHYGDWLASGETAFLAYYERYADGTWGVAYPAPAEDGTETVTSTLREGGDAFAVEDGYGVLSPSAMSALPVGAETVALTETDCALSVDDKDYRLYALDGAWTLSHHGYYQTAVGGRGVWFDPDFAKTATLTETTAAARYLVRSVRQLDNIDDPLYTGPGVTFDQDLTIDGAAYVGAVYGKSAGEWTTFPAQYAAAPFAGTLDGHRDKGFMIRNLSITGTMRAGLFEEIGAGAVVRNVALASVRVNGTGWGQAYTGGLAGVISGGEVSNSGVFVVDAAGDTRNAPYEDYPVTATSSNEAGVGGLAGSVTGGTVSKCFAAVKVDGGNAGGLVGRLTGGEVRDCYAAGHTVNGVFEAPTGGKSANVTGYTAAGGFVGDWTAGTISGTCYTTLSVEGKWGSRPGAFAGTHPAGAKLPGGYAKSYVYQDGNSVNPTDVAELGLDTSSVYTGDKGPANPYDSSLSTEYDFKPIPGLEHYGDWSLKKLRGLVAYYEQVELPQSGGGGSNLKTEFFYYEREKTEAGGYVLTEKGTLDKTRTGALYSDGYAFLSLNQLHQTGQENQPVTLKIDIGGSATLADMEEYPTTYLGGFNADLAPFVEKWDGTKPYYYAYGLPNAALDVAANADEYFLQLKVAGLDSEAEQSSLWLNPHFGRTAYNGYGETNPKDGNPKVRIPDGDGDMIPIRSVRQFNNMRKYPSDIRSWTQELDLDGSAYKGHVDVDGEGYLTVGGLRVATQSGGTWSPVKAPSATPTTADLPQSYRLEIEPIYMTSSGKSVTFGGAYDGGGHTIRALSVPTITIDSSQYAALFYRLSGKGALKNIELADTAIQGVSASGNNYTGALVGYTEGTVVNCTAQNCTVTQENGNSKSYVGGLVGYARAGEIGVDEAGTAGPCAAINCAVDGGASDSVGGFVGYVRGATLQNCGARVEAATVGGAKKTAADLYDTQMVQGNNQVGGFAGGIEEGSVQYCYAAVKVRGGTAGGFAGKLLDKKEKSVVKDSYAAGHTHNGVYAAGDPNVMGEKAVGGFLGAWSGGTLEGLCYTTCSAGTVNGGLDVFAPASGKTAPAGSYAGGDVMKSGAAQGVSQYNVTKVAVRPLPERPAAEQGEAAPYDRTLPQKYSHQPVTLPDGSPMPHYGDWYHKKTSSNREWVQQVENYTPIEKPYENLEAEAKWSGDTMHLTFTVSSLAYENDLTNTGPRLPDGTTYFNGVFCLTSDLGYRNIFRVVNQDGYQILGLDGATFTREEIGTPGQEGHGFVWDIFIPSSQVPPFVNAVSLDAMEHIDGEGDKCIIANIINSDPGYYAANKVPHLANDQGITIGEGAANTTESFQDWLGYEHQLLEMMAPLQGTPLYGHKEGSALGYGNKVYFHLYNTNPTEVAGQAWAGTVRQLTIGGFSELTFTGPGVSETIPGWQLGNDALSGARPGTTDVSITRKRDWQDENWQWQSETFNIGRIFCYTSTDREEMEVEFDLDEVAKSFGYENGDVFTDVVLKFENSTMRSLRVKRDPAD